MIEPALALIDFGSVAAGIEAAQAMPELYAPVDLAITGLVDDVHVVAAARRGPPTAAWRREE